MSKAFYMSSFVLNVVVCGATVYAEDYWFSATAALVAIRAAILEAATLGKIKAG